ncbi:E3 ubiquitin ligase, partial [Perilla frutescens var. hirtella]
MPQGGVRELSVLTKFKPFGFTAEALDGGSLSGDDDDYHYFLFDPQVATQRDEGAELDDASSSDHELFVRGNRIIWSAGTRVYKRFTLPSKVIKVCWSRMSDMSEALLCVLQVDRLTIYGIAGEVVSVPLPYAVTSIWPLPFGLLLQRASEGSLLTNISLSSSSPYLSARDVFRQKRDVYTPTHMFDYCTRSDGTSISSHMILKDPLEDPQITYIEERGKLNLMWEFDERTIWTSDCVPLMVSYNKGKMQHSLWVVEVNNSNIQVANPNKSDLISPWMSAKHFFRRIWQGKGSHTPASK